MGLLTPETVEKLQAALPAKACVLVRKPDAGNPPVRFDEREPETERVCATAPVLDSTAFSAPC